MHILFLEPFLTPILLFCIALVLGLGYALIRRIYKREKQFEEKQEGEFLDYDKVLADAHTKAEQILEEAVGEANKLSREEDDFAKNVNKQVNESYKEIIEKNIATMNSSSHEFLTSFHSSLQSLKTKYEQEIEGMIQKIQHDTQNDLTELQQLIRQKTLGTQDGFSKQLEDEFNKTQIEIHEYKKRKLHEINQRMDKIIITVSEEVLGQAIPLEQHQQLIIQALEKAQKEGMFDA